MRTDIDGMASLAKLVLDADQRKWYDGRPSLGRIAGEIRHQVDGYLDHGVRSLSSGGIYSRRASEFSPNCIEVYVKIGEIEVAAENAS